MPGSRPVAAPPDEWLRLARSRVVLGEHDQAAAALARARVALANDPQGLAQVEQAARALGLDNAPSQPAPGPADRPARAETEAAMAAVRAMPQAERDAAIRGMVEGLDRRLAARGGMPDEWLRLVRSYSALGERDKAISALDRARMALAANARGGGPPRRARPGTRPAGQAQSLTPPSAPRRAYDNPSRTAALDPRAAGADTFRKLE